MSEEKEGKSIEVGFETDPKDPKKKRVAVKINENGETTLEDKSESFEVPETETEAEKENADLKNTLIAVAQKQFEDDKEKVYVKLRNLGLDELSEIAKTATLPSQIEQLQKIVENKEADLPVPKGSVSLPNSGSYRDAYQWRTKNYSSAKEMIDDLYNRLEMSDVSTEEKAQIEKTLSDLFRKYKGNATTERGS